MIEIIKEFFSFKGGIGFEMFGRVHKTTILLFIICILILYKNKEKIKRYKHKNKIPYIAAGILVLNRLIFTASVCFNGIYNWKYDLPLHFCFIAAYVFIIAVITKSTYIYKLSYYFSIAGPLVAIIIPNTTQNTGIQLGPDRYIYYQFIIAHHFLILANLYMLWVMDVDIKYKDAKSAFIVGNIMVLFVNIFNVLCGTNYSMLKEIPKEAINSLPCLDIGSPIIWLEIGALIMILIAMIPIKMNKKREESIKMLHEAA